METALRNISLFPTEKTPKAVFNVPDSKSDIIVGQEDICDKIVVEENTDIADSLNSMATLCYRDGKYDVAELLYQAALDICEDILGKQHSDKADSLHGLATVYYCQNKYNAAELLYITALSIREKVL